jgi:hypothetical protein
MRPILSDWLIAEIPGTPPVTFSLLQTCCHQNQAMGDLGDAGETPALPVLKGVICNQTTIST